MTDARIELLLDDITSLKVDAIVNAANTQLKGGGGVDGAIHKAAGPILYEECSKIIEEKGSCSVGEAVLTSAGNLPCKHIIHTVGPIWTGGTNNEEKLLARAYFNSLLLAKEKKIKTVAFPNISTGVYGFPKQRAAEIAVQEVKNFLDMNASIEKVIFVCFEEANYLIYKNILGM
ncbi:MAG: O-acetyl-ADP-ribose deacetylase [Ignavibacteria bacterium]|jgi:O-acetyl-ADP-ribose deacetylase (regulator of RNase III)|nr:O-acetyl-ADP-ribose deacetylase [Ignavibacteria bacterium]